MPTDVQVRPQIVFRTAVIVLCFAWYLRSEFRGHQQFSLRFVGPDNTTWYLNEAMSGWPFLHPLRSSIHPRGLARHSTALNLALVVLMAIASIKFYERIPQLVDEPLRFRLSTLFFLVTGLACLLALSSYGPEGGIQPHGWNQWRAPSQGFEVELTAERLRFTQTRPIFDPMASWADGALRCVLLLGLIPLVFMSVRGAQRALQNCWRLAAQALTATPLPKNTVD